MSISYLQRVLLPKKSLFEYETLLPETVSMIKEIARFMQGISICHLNATSVGGGVAEMLRSQVALENNLGFSSSWVVLPPNTDFFAVTKKIHNLLQGQPGELRLKEKSIYINYNQKIAKFISDFNPTPDILIVHDPQPAAAIQFVSHNRPKVVIWRSHIDTSYPNKNMWDFLLHYLTSYDHFVFTHQDFTQNAFPKNKISFITPFIDPLSPKNRLMNVETAKHYIRQLGIDTGKPLLTQVSRLDPWKDPFGVIDAYRIVKEEFPNLQLALVAQSATDDPEGEEIFQKVKNYIKGEKDIFLFFNLPDNDNIVNAFQTASDIVLQKSVREGFGLTVTEAMWKGAVVIAGDVGGIRLQILDGKNGFLVKNTLQFAEKIRFLLKNPRLKNIIGKAAHNTVYQKFLLPSGILNYLMLYKKLYFKKGEDYENYFRR